MHYLIDGHNLIAHLDDISLDEPDDEAKLVQKLTSFVARTRSRCIVVFDQGLPGGWSRMSTHSVQVIFANHKSSADRVLRDYIHARKDTQNWTVVSSDNEILSRARARKMPIIRSADFAHQLKHPKPVKPDAGEAADVRLSEQEVDEWARLFQVEDDTTPAKKKKTARKP